MSRLRASVLRRLRERHKHNGKYVKPRVERLEPRLVLSSIHGVKFEDVDANGVFDPTIDRRFAGVAIGLLGDANGDGSDELQLARTSANGEFSFLNLAAGPYTLTESPPAGTVPTTPASRQLAVPPDTQLVADPSQAIAGQGTVQVLGPQLMFGNAISAAIHGFKFEDVNKNGTYEPATDKPFAGVLVGLFGDTDGDGGLDLLSTETDALGRFSFPDLFPGTFLLGEIPPDGTGPTTPATLNVTAQSGQALMALSGQAALGPGQTEVVLGSELMFGNGLFFVEVDQFHLSLGQLLIETPAGTELIATTGPAEVHVFFDGLIEGSARDNDGNRLDEVRTELVSMQLSGPSSAGLVEISLRDDVRSIGQIEERQQVVPGTLDIAPFTPAAVARSFFDVWPEITIAGQRFITDRPLRLDELNLQHKPPQGDARYISGARQPVDQQHIVNLQLSVVGSLFFNDYGGQEKWLRSGSNFSWYVILPNGQLIRWDGTPGQLSGSTVGFLDPIAYDDPITHLVNVTNASNIPVLPADPPIELLTESGQSTGIFIVREVHQPLPFVEVDTFDISLGQLLIQAPDGSTELVGATGPAEVNVFFDGGTEGVAFDDDLDRLDEVITELVSLNMTGYSPSVGLVEIGLRDDVRSMGQIEERLQIVDGTLDVDPFTAGATGESFFDVWPVVTLAGQRLVTNQPIRLTEPNLLHKPPRGDARYINDARKTADQQQVFNLNLFVSGDLFFDLYNGREKWLLSANDSVWYFILPTGELIRWSRVPGVLSGISLGFLDPIAHEDPVTHIVNATSPGNIPVLAAVGPTELFTENGQGTGFFIIREVHQPEPFVEIDRFAVSVGQLLIQWPDGGTELVVTTGPAEAHVFFDGATEGVAFDDDLDQRDEVISELASLNLTGVTSLGPIQIGIRTDIRSLGQIEEHEQLNVGVLDVAPFTANAFADSFFDVWPEIFLAGQRLITNVPLRLVEPNLQHKPPRGDARYISANGQPVELIDAATGQGTGIFIIRKVYQPSPFVEVDDFNVSLGQLLIRLPDGSTELVAAEGPATAHVFFDGGTEGTAFDDDLDQRDEVITELVSLNMTGVSSLGTVEIGLRSNVRSLGQIEEHEQLNLGVLDVDPFTADAVADSFFDVWPVVTVNGQRLVTDGPLRLVEPNLQHKPPQGNARYINGNSPADQQEVFDLRLFVSESLFFDLYGGREKWLFSATQSAWYIIFPTGELRRWDGAPGRLSGPSQGFLELKAYQDPILHIVNAATAADIPVLPPISPVELLTETGQRTGIFIVRAVHHPEPFVEIDVFNSTLGQLLLELPNQPGVVTTRPGLPPTDGVYQTAPQVHATYANSDLQVVLQDIRHRPLADPPPVVFAVDSDEIEGFQSSLTGTAVITSSSLGLNSVPVSIELTGLVQTRVFGKANQTTGSFQTELLSMSLAGITKLPNGDDLTIMLRESLTQQSQGQVTITDLNDGRFQIDSFFDVFTELSIDGGQSYIPSTGSTNVVAFPAPELVALQGPSTVHVFFDGATEGVAFDDDQNGRDEVITELVALDLTGVSPLGPLRATVRNDIRSMGRIEEHQQLVAGTLDVGPFTAGATADSFFDVWTEITVDGRRLVTRSPLRLETPNLQHKPPQGNTRYTNPFAVRVELIDAATGVGTGIFILRAIYHPVPATEVDQFNVTLGQLLIQLPDGRQELVAAVGPATVNVFFDGGAEGVALDDDGNGRDEVITELASLNMTGTSSLGPVAIGLRGNARSMGRIEERSQIIAGTLDVDPFTANAVADSFFDVWPEITVGSQRLVTSQPLRLVEPNLQHKPPRGDARYINTITQPIELLDAATGQGTGIFIIREVHHPAPFVEVDTFNISLGQLLIQLPNGQTELVPALGPAEVHVFFDGASEGVAFDDDLDGRDEVITELVSLDMTGYSSLGPVAVGLRSDVRSLGQIEEQQQLANGTLDVDPFAAAALGDSFFDVWPLITIGGQRFVTDRSLRLTEPNLQHKPPRGDARYINDIRQPANQQQVFNLNLVVSGSLSFNLYGGEEKWLRSGNDFVWYFIFPTGEVIRWNGVAGELQGQSLGFLDVLAYQDPVKHIVQATAPSNIPVLRAGPVELLTESGLATGIFIVREVHHPLPFVENDTFSSSLGQLLVELPGPPGIVTRQPGLPPTDGVYRTPPQVQTAYQSGGLRVVLQDLWHRALVDPAPTVTNVGGDEVENFQSLLTGTAFVTLAALGLDQAPVAVELRGPVQTIVFGKAGQTTGSFDTEIVSMSLSGDALLPGGQLLPLVIRESPSQPSQGQVAITQLSDGQFQIDSFFDVFTELSLSGGGTFIPSSTSTRVELAPSPELVAVEGSTTVHVYFDSATEGVAFDDDLNGRDEVIIEMVDMNLTGSSPLGTVRTTLRSDIRSLGRIDEHQQIEPGRLDVDPFTTGASAESFFDVWTEITIDGRRLITQQPFHLEERNLQHKPPQGDERYINPFLVRVELLDAVTGAGTGIFVLRAIHHPLPATQVNQFDISLGQLLIQRPDGQRELVPAEGAATVNVFFDSATEGVAFDDDLNGRDEVITELVSLNLTGLSSFGPVEVGLRNDVRSMGRIEEHRQVVSGALDVDPVAANGTGDSFFDVWPVVTLGGQRFVTNRSLRLVEPNQLHQPPRGAARYIQNLTNDPIELIDEATGQGSGLFIVRNVQHPLPFVEVDTFNITLGQLLIQRPDGGTELVGAVGPAEAHVFFDGATEGVAFDDDLDGRDEVIAELVSMTLTGQSSLGPVEIGVRDDVRSMGRIDEQQQLVSGTLDVDPFTANAKGDSFFDVWPTFTVGGQRMFTLEPLRLLEPDLQHQPPRGDARFISNITQPVELFDSATGLGTGIFIVRQVHHPLPFVEMDVFDVTLGQMLIRRPDGELELVAAAGPAEMHVYFDGATEGVAFDDDLDGRDEVFTELVSMNLTGASTLGAVEFHVRDDFRSMGRIDELVQINAGTLDIDPFTASAVANSFFDVWPEIILDGQRLLTDRPLRLVEPNLTHKPPRGSARFISLDSAAPVELLTETGQPTGIFIVRNVFQPLPASESSAYASSRFVLTLENEAGATAVLPRNGESTIDVFFDGDTRGDALDDDQNGLDEVVSEITRFSFGQLTASPLGTIRVLPDTSIRTLGLIEEGANAEVGRLDVDPFFPFGVATSFFHLPLIVEVDGQPLRPESVLRLQTPLSSWPPVPGATYELPAVRIPLLDANGDPTDLFIQAASFTPLLEEDPGALRSAPAVNLASSEYVLPDWNWQHKPILRPEDWVDALSRQSSDTIRDAELANTEALLSGISPRPIEMTRRDRLFAGFARADQTADLLAASEFEKLIGSLAGAANDPLGN